MPSAASVSHLFEGLPNEQQLILRLRKRWHLQDRQISARRGIHVVLRGQPTDVRLNAWTSAKGRLSAPARRNASRAPPRNVCTSDSSSARACALNGHEEVGRKRWTKGAIASGPRTSEYESVRNGLMPPSSTIPRGLSLEPPSEWRVKGLTIREKGVPIR